MAKCLHRSMMKDERLSLQRLTNIFEKLYPESLNLNSLSELFDNSDGNAPAANNLILLEDNSSILWEDLAPMTLES